MPLKTGILSYVVMFNEECPTKNYLQCSKSNLIIYLIIFSGVFRYFHNVDYKVYHITKVALNIDLIEQEVPK